MVTMTSRRINADGSVGFDLEIEFPTRTFTDTIDFDGKDAANKYFASTVKSVLCHNLDFLLRIILNKESAEYLAFREQYLWCLDMNVDHKTFIDIVKLHAPSIQVISADSDEAKSMAGKIIKFCTT